ncbi:RHS repeat-associated core domain-containing protein [Paenibacillus sp. PsM32]|uniref:RHS repeat domain-containing protein n=1 Tax=Paenibacillus sp. PsM32 TaxID=3030536 RepID=UPI00263A5A6E|nr:RHS repeat-associated core domain-containing protein [Paenibacillus sp. PsM32]MDN4619635.1 RHS repeat-associated core domain-containing protein [Paenibacillus sp. PsM32]
MQIILKKLLISLILLSIFSNSFRIGSNTSLLAASNPSSQIAFPSIHNISPPDVTRIPEDFKPTKIEPLKAINLDQVIDNVYKDNLSTDSSLMRSFGVSTKMITEEENNMDGFSKIEIPEIPDSALTNQQVEDLILHGATEWDVYQIHKLMQLNAIDPLNVWIMKQESGLTWEEWLLSKQADQQGLKGASSVTEDVYVPIDHEFENTTVSTDTYSGNGLSSSLRSMRSMTATQSLNGQVDNVLRGLVMLQQVNQTAKEQYSDREGTNEIIDPATGALTWKSNILNYSGRDGLDLDLSLMYQSNQAYAFLTAKGKFPVAHYPGDGGEPIITYPSDAGNILWKTDNYNLSRYNIGLGWSFQFPSVQHDSGYSYYHDGHGAVYQIDFKATKGLETTTHLKNYSGKTMKFMQDNNGTFNNGQVSSAYYLEYADKKREYFAADGLLIGIVDRFDNKIIFEHSEKYTYDGNAKLISYITDSLGRKLYFQYFYNGAKTTTIVYSITQGEETRVELVIRTDSPYLNYKEQTVGFAPMLSEIATARLNSSSGEYDVLEEIRFNYNSKTARFNYGEKNYHPNMGVNVYNLLTEIEYPKSYSYYEYNNQVIRNLGHNGMTDDFTVTTRSDEYKKQDESKHTQLLNHINYTYLGEYTGYPDVRHPEQLPESYRYGSTATSQSSTARNGNKTITTFNGKGAKISTEHIASNGERKIENILSYHPDFKFSPLKISTTTQDSVGSHKLFVENMYDGLGNITQTTLPLTENQLNDVNFKRTHSTTYSYEPNYNLLATKTSYQQENQPLIEKYYYNSQGRLQSTTDANDQTTTYTYEMVPGQEKIISRIIEEHPIREGLKSKIIIDYGSETSYTYPSKITEYFKSSTNGETKQTQKSWTYRLKTGQILTEKDTEGKETSNTYDIWDRLISTKYPAITNNDGEKYSQETKMTYHQVYAKMDLQQSPIAATQINTETEYTQQSNGVQSAFSPIIEIYNGWGQPISQSAVDFRKGFPDNIGFLDVQNYDYNDQQQPIQTKKFVYWYNKNGTVYEEAYPSILQNKLAYDVWGELKETIDTKGNITSVETEPSQYKETLSFMDANRDKLNVVEQNYDQWGNLLTTKTFKNVQVKNEVIQESYTYDITGNVISYTDPKKNQNNEGVTQRFTYDRLNRLTSLKDALNQTATYRYDGNDQLIHVSLNDTKGTPTQTIYNKDYNESSLLLSKTDPENESTQNQYDHLGRLQSTKDRNGASTKYTYDEQNQIKTYQKIMSSPKKQTVNYYHTFGKDNILTSESSLEMSGASQIRQITTIDTSQRVTQRQDFNTNNDYFSVSKFSYDVWGRQGSRTLFYGGGENGFTSALQQNNKYDNHEQLIEVSTGKNNDYKVTYAYRPQGMLESITHRPLVTGKILKANYTYNTLNQLTAMTNNLDKDELSASLYDYDSNGNIVKSIERRKGQDTTEKRYEYDKLNRLIEVYSGNILLSRYTYDLRGNRLTLENNQEEKLSEINYGYNALDQLDQYKEGTTSTTFHYLPSGIRYEKNVSEKDNQGRINTKKHHYVSNDEGKVVFEAMDQKFNEYIRGDRVLLKFSKSNLYNSQYSTPHYYLYNGHGDVIGLLDGYGTQVNTYDYDEFGNTVAEKEKTWNPFKYAGEYQDNESGLYYLNARYYDPSMGRFLNEDTYEGDIYDLLTLNVFTYVINNPLIYTDPTGNHHRADGGAVSGGGRASVPKWMTWGADKPTIKSNTSLSAAKRVNISPSSRAKISNSSFSKQVSQQVKDAMTVKNGTLAFKNFDLANAYVKPKHLSNSGNGGKFIETTKREAEETLRKAMRRGVIDQVKDNGLTSQGKQSYEIIIDAGKVVGTKGQERIKIVISEDGGMLSAYPVR